MRLDHKHTHCHRPVCPLCVTVAPQKVALRKNPCLTSPRDRKTLLSNIPTLWASLDCVLDTIDNPITLDEIVEAWRAVGVKQVRRDRPGELCSD